MYLFVGSVLVSATNFATCLDAAHAQTRSVLLRDSFPIGSAEGVLCSVQDRSAGNDVAMSLFDRRWAIVCRDSAQPVAEVYAFANTPSDPLSKVQAQRGQAVDCADARSGTDSEISAASRRDCKVEGTSLGWSTLIAERGEWTYVVDGFSAYDDAMRLALRSVLDNRIAQGTIDAATTSVNDPLAFSRVQAESLQPEQALIEGYRRNLGGEYAEAAAYFETLQYRLEREGDNTIHPSEFVLNRALQKSNLGDFAEAEALFEQANAISAGNVVGERLQRNFEAIHLLNRGRPQLVAGRLAQPLSSAIDGIAIREGEIEISVPISDRLNSRTRGSLIGFASETRLTLRERAEIIDAQALQIAGTAQRLLGDLSEARNSLNTAMDRAMSVRDGRVTTIVRMRSQIMGDLARIAELDGDLGQAESLLRSGLALLETQYPERRAVAGAEARLAAFLLRNGRQVEALALYERLVDGALAKNTGATGITNQLTPYYRYLAEQSASDEQAAARFFKAAQLLVRPGIAETQAVFARELSGGSDEAARLFRQSTDLSREIERKRIRFLQLTRNSTGGEAQRLAAELSQEIGRLEDAQLRTQVQLADFPQYRMVANRAIELAEFQALLAPGEAYARLAQSGTDLFMVFASRDHAQVWQVPLSQEDLDFHVDVIRASIAIEENGQLLTYPFDVDMARSLFTDLFGPIADRLQVVDHLIFEPDGAMLRLPVDLLVTDDRSLANYRNQSSSDEYDFRNVAWLGKGRRISTAVSAQGFVDARRAPSSRATNEYLGMGENTPVGQPDKASFRGAVVTGNDRCGWNIANWNRPIDDRELRVASSIIGGGRSQIQTGSQFTDSSIKARGDLDQFRILHFATHGLVTPPRPECAAQPALLTSFGASEESDGLLSFDEIFDLDLDADLVILSACDTAAGATVEATRAAGLTSGGGTALDGLVRAFVGAGGRTVLASHWPAPDDFGATEKLMSTMFREGQTASIGDALKRSQQTLMDEATTSHPYYWAGFALIGDSNRALLSRGQASNERAATTAVAE